MVGTFYAAPSPDSAPFVRQGDHVSKGQVVCIVEAMKLINEIESEVSGTIVRVAVENALDYVAQFIAGVARSAHDKGLEQAALSLAKARASGISSQNEITKLTGLVRQRLTQKLAI